MDGLEVNEESAYRKKAKEAEAPRKINIVVKLVRRAEAAGAREIGVWLEFAGRGRITTDNRRSR